MRSPTILRVEAETFTVSAPVSPVRAINSDKATTVSSFSKASSFFVRGFTSIERNGLLITPQAFPETARVLEDLQGRKCDKSVSLNITYIGSI